MEMVLHDLLSNVELGFSPRSSPIDRDATSKGHQPNWNRSLLMLRLPGIIQGGRCRMLRPGNSDRLMKKVYKICYSEPFGFAQGKLREESRTERKALAKFFIAYGSSK
jgi:hypothetical protein